MDQYLPPDVRYTIKKKIVDSIDRSLKECSMLQPYIHWQSHGWPGLQVEADMVVESLKFTEASLTSILEVDLETPRSVFPEIVQIVLSYVKQTSREIVEPQKVNSQNQKLRWKMYEESKIAKKALHIEFLKSVLKNMLRHRTLAVFANNRQYQLREQVFISYGRKSNGELLLSYGFVPREGTNPSDSVEFSLSLKKSDKCYKEKLAALKKHGLSASQCFPVRVTGWPVELIAYAYLTVSPPSMSMKFDELAAAASNKTNSKKDIKFPEIVEKALQFVLDSCEISISKYTKILQESGSMDLDVTSPKQLNRRLFLKQLAVDLCNSERRILFRAQNVFNLETFKWSFGILFSRLVRLPSMDGKVALVPWADMLNHSCEVETFLDYDKSSQGVYFTTDRQYQLREQVFISYGRKSNGELLLSYGFVPREGTNPSDSVELSLFLKKSDKCYKEKSDIFSSFFSLLKGYKLPSGSSS
ncbi:uncharacterized protein LOC126657247 [Mercurialis annua]|uniref:uncharacterized protein LOC126657247 n=1 Tax=Mercurialis annua TaxID=3986 RepID=UPI0024AE4130|nr:uncharacterized protein LOC126657247 [Mercurialis annua]